MDVEVAIISMGVLYFLGHFLTHFFNRSNIPDVLILIAFGIVVGPVLKVVTPEMLGGAGRIFTSIALIIILFDGGLDLEFKTIMRSMALSLRVTVLCFLTTALVTCLLMHYMFGYSVLVGLITGFICGGTSSAVVIPMVNVLKVGSESRTTLVLESALTDVLCIVFTLGVLQSMESGTLLIGHMIGKLISSLVLAMLTGALSGFVWLRLLNKIRTYPNTQFATFAIVFIVYGIAESLGFSGAIAALAFGIVLGNHSIISYRLRQFVGTRQPMGVLTDAEKILYKEIVFLLKIFFFVYLGISIPLGHVSFVVMAMCMVLAVYLLRPFIIKAVVRKADVSTRDMSILGVMAPKGLAAAVLAGLPMQYGVFEGSDIQSITYNVVLISIVATSILVPLLQRTFVGRISARFYGRSKTDNPTK